MRTITTLALLVFVASASAQTTWRVDDDAAPGGDGLAWATAFDDLQSALDVAVEDDEIRVARGSYVPSTTVIPGDPRSATFELVSGVRLIGGYAGIGADDPDEFDPSVHETVLSGDLAGDDGPGPTSNAENAYHVVYSDGDDDSTLLSSVTIVGGNADSGSALSFTGAGGGVLVENGSPMLMSCIIKGNSASSGGGFLLRNSDSFVIGCTISDNIANVGGGGQVRLQGLGTMIDCEFRQNTADTSGAGGLINGYDAEMVLYRCLFRSNTAASTSGAVEVSNTALVHSCTFIDNRATLAGGAMVITSSADLTIVNSVFSRHFSTLGGALYLNGPATLDTTTINGSLGGGGGVMVAGDGDVSIVNSILSNNTGGEVIPDPVFGAGPISVSNSLVPGGWTGTGSNNIDAFPFFVQPGADDLRLAFGSPGLDDGDASLLPLDELDTDEDGNATEPIPFDRDGQLRVQGGSVDLGAYEGAFPPLPPAAMEDDIDNGETVFLFPEPGGFSPLESTSALVTNVSAPDDQVITATLPGAKMHSGAGVFATLDEILRIETSMADGDYTMTVFVTFDADDLDDADPYEMRAVAFNPPTGNWALAVQANTESSPGKIGPIGDLWALEGPGPIGATLDLGDHGVYWDPTAGTGVVWANVDHAGDFGVGRHVCPSDADGSGTTDIDDVLAVIFDWDTAGIEHGGDVNLTGVVDADDVVDVVLGFGQCP